MSQEGFPPEEVAEEEEHPQRRREWRGVFRSVILPIAVVAAIAFGVWYFEGQGSSTGGEGSDALGIVELPAAKNPTGRSPAAQAGRAAPDLRLATLDGDIVRLSDLQGKAVVVNFWATWCGPCRKEFPEFVQAYDEFHEQGLEIIGVNVQEPRERVAAFVEEFGAQFIIALDSDGQVTRGYRVTGLPVTVFIDRQGVVQSVYVGQLNRELLLERLEDIL